MEFINIPTSLFSSPEFIGAEPVQRATWISLLAWCCEQENGGVINDCRNWGMRRWMQTCGATDQEIGMDCELYRFDGDSLVVFGYPHKIQSTLETKRDTARENGKLGGRPKKSNPETNEETEVKPTSVILETNVGSEIGTEIGTYVGGNVETNIATYQETVREGKGRERKVSNIGDNTAFSRKAPLPGSADEVKACLQAEVLRGCLLLSESQLVDSSMLFFDDKEACGWVDAKGNPINDWRAAARAYARRYAANHPGVTINNNSNDKKTYGY